MDRNVDLGQNCGDVRKSLSARRAWIEIPLVSKIDVGWWVALRKESVDRNDIETSRVCTDIGRSPQGERG